ncbi:hypothetical protein BU16DRAFT_619620 [Lophium mytilinum]|uniref:Uncharacterized protein n=1 Tax=Lophium mytilinum TaxID=390894 RepID=A0A6A6QME0_9PEZI|nr:hypothetical protein BU16DRAFT_619620 [Lophium mytilinum]
MADTTRSPIRTPGFLAFTVCALGAIALSITLLVSCMSPWTDTVSIAKVNVTKAVYDLGIFITPNGSVTSTAQTFSSSSIPSEWTTAFALDVLPEEYLFGLRGLPAYLLSAIEFDLGSHSNLTDALDNWTALIHTAGPKANTGFAHASAYLLIAGVVVTFVLLIIVIAVFVLKRDKVHVAMQSFILPAAMYAVAVGLYYVMLRQWTGSGHGFANPVSTSKGMIIFWVLGGGSVAVALIVIFSSRPRRVRQNNGYYTGRPGYSGGRMIYVGGGGGYYAGGGDSGGWGDGGGDGGG